MGVVQHSFTSNQDLSTVLSRKISADLESALQQAGHATLAVSGGSTPKPLFDALSQCELDWSKVYVTQVDERWVPEYHADSNAALIREHLLQNKASEAQFLSMKTDEDDVFAAESACSQRLAPFAAGIDVAVLGMGEDGHTASFFPDAEQLDAALDPSSKALCLGLRPPLAPHDRMTLSLAALLRSHALYLHITGEKKLAVLNQALSGQDARELPIRAVFNRSENPLEIYYAPGS